MGLRRGDVVRVRITRVVDGDTVWVRRRRLWSRRSGSELRVRLYGIDAPESDQSFGTQSTRALERELQSGSLYMEVMDTDRYGRLVGLLYRHRRGRRNSVNLRMVRKGWAHAYTRYGGSEFGFAAAEARARAKRAGLWRSARVRRGGERPWDHRRGQRRASSGWGRVWARLLRDLSKWLSK